MSKKLGEAWKAVPGGYPKEHGSTRRCIVCGYHPIARGTQCPNCGRGYDGEPGGIPEGRSPRARQGEGFVDDDA